MKYTLTQPQPSLQSDLQRLVSIIRERESSLVILLEEKHQQEWERPSWLLKQCEYQEKENRLSREIRSIILKWVLMANEDSFSEQLMKQIRTFWVKVKMVMKMSLQRMKLLNLLSYNLFEQYQAIIQAMNQGYDRCAGISHYRDIQQMIKNRNRNIHDLLSCGIQIHSNRQRYELTVKHSVKEFPSDCKIKHPLQSSKGNKQMITIDSKALRRPSSHLSNKNQLNSKSFLVSKKIKKIQKFISTYQEKIGDLMSAKIEVNLDNKKSLQQNIEHLYDNIMQKNISNHKIISKFIFSHSGRALKKIPSKRHLKPSTKKIVQIESAKPTRKQPKKKPKLSLPYHRAASAKLKRKELKQIYKLRHSQIIEDGKIKNKKILLR